MIDKDNRKELDTIDTLISKHIKIVDKKFVVNIIGDAIKDAIDCNKEVKDNIRIIAAEYPRFSKVLLEVVKEEFQEYEDYTRKILVLI